jgi:tetratricopeptide (TPR) repeat protein
MALDREKTFQNAERLLKQGRVAQALEECRRLAEDAPKDLLMLNRLGDFLARGNRGADAIVYYEMIADQFSASGFYPKAIAILKKIVKVDPSHTASVVKLGELNLKQKLPGEARTWLLQGAEAYSRRREFAKAREVYEKLVAAEPDNYTHAARLAETRVAEGDAARAGLELVALAVRMIAAGRRDDAERTFVRATEILPGRAEPLVGLAKSRAAAGRRDEALKLIDDAWNRSEGAESVAGDVLLLLEQLGDGDRSATFLADARSDAVSDESMEAAFRNALAAGTVDDLWSRVVPFLDRWARARDFDRSARLLERLARIEEGGHLRALEQLVEMRKAEGTRATAARAVERLVRAYRSKGLTAKAMAQLETLKLFDPTSPLLFIGRPAGEEPASSSAPAASAPAATAPQASAKGSEPPPPGAFEAPAVPIAPADLEFVSGNLTEAEVFEKYGLHREALQQLRQITERFPGHVVAQEKLVGFIRTQSDRPALRDGLVALAFAKRASGDSEGARRAAGEAASLGGIDERVRGVLERFSLLSPVEAPASKPAAPVAAAHPPAPPAPKAAAAPSSPRAAAPPAAPAPEPMMSLEGDEELEILFDDVDEPVEAAGTGSDILEEIEFYLGQGMEQDALKRIAEARAAGLASAALDGLEARARSATPAIASDDAADGIDRLDEEDLSSITAALEAEYGTDRVGEAPEAPAEPESEKSVEEVFETFKEHVSAAVEAGDFRTHYDLGIAYKEMGLMDDAIAEFRIASGTPELYREACSMLGICHWERGRADEAIRWYRAAIEAPGAEETPLSGLRYDLAAMLEQTGDVEGAYELLAQVLSEEPGYRDAETKIAALRGRLGL